MVIFLILYVFTIFIWVDFILLKDDSSTNASEGSCSLELDASAIDGDSGVFRPVEAVLGNVHD